MADLNEGDRSGMGGAAELDRKTLVALIDRMIRAEAREDAPPQTERDDWLYGSIEPLAFTEPDTHGWMAIAPSVLPKRWIPRALCFWHSALGGGGEVSPTLMAHPHHSLAHWPAIERAVQAYMAAPAPRSGRAQP